jgi:pimeloyl-ACP methyl ester carboxylesterase
VEPFTIDIPDAVLDDLRARLLNTRWALDLDNEDETYGIGTAYLREIVAYWVDGFDWRGVERQINRIPQYRATIDGTPVHFLRLEGRGPSPMPIVLSHGWPWTFWDWSRVIGQLADPAAYGGDPADAFDVIVPSLAGFAFSTPTTGDMNFWKMADLWHTLMTERLGYPRYAAAGADYGAMLTIQLGHKHASSLYGIHLCQDAMPTLFNGDRPWDITDGYLGDGADGQDALLRLERAYFSHVAVHMLDAQTLTHGLTDSPVAMLAWILRRYRSWSDRDADFATVFPRDHVLTNATIYWVTASIGQSIRSYRNANRYPWRPSHDRLPVVEAPTGFTFLCGNVHEPGNDPEARLRAFETGSTAPWFNTVYANAHPSGGHFVPWENPDAFIGDVRAMFRPLRPGHSGERMGRS